jgi:hypothetical protein
MRKTLITVCALIILFALLWTLRSKDQDEQLAIPSASSISDPTNFVETGILSFPNKKDTGQDTIYFSYQSSPGAPITSMELPLSEQTICVASSGSVPCMAMNSKYSVAFDGKSAIVEGIEKEAKLNVLVIRVYSEEARILPPQVGITYIPWQSAVQLIESCKPTAIKQTHNLNVGLRLADGKMVYAIEPVIDEVFRVTDRVQSKCPPIPIATE